MMKATFGAGCFWCVEAIFQKLEGVEKVESGYMGGNTINPSYKEVCTGTTGHAEVVQVTYDPAVVSYKKLLEVFFKTHDPTTLNRQGNDKGTQYRSVIFYHNNDQQEQALEIKQSIEENHIWKNPLVTEISEAKIFYKAENYHQDYYNNNKDTNSYCSLVITPKIEKFISVFQDKLN